MFKVPLSWNYLWSTLPIPYLATSYIVRCLSILSHTHIWISGWRITRHSAHSRLREHRLKVNKSFIFPFLITSCRLHVSTLREKNVTIISQILPHKYWLSLFTVCSAWSRYCMPSTSFNQCLSRSHFLVWTISFLRPNVQLKILLAWGNWIPQYVNNQSTLFNCYF